MMYHNKLLSLSIAVFLIVTTAQAFYQRRSIQTNEDPAHSKTALIIGVTGQDGAYLSEFLLGKNYIVHGVKRRASTNNTSRIDHLCDDHLSIQQRFFLHDGDITDASNMLQIVQNVQPDEIYNLAAQSHVQVSF